MSLSLNPPLCHPSPYVMGKPSRLKKRKQELAQKILDFKAANEISAPGWVSRVWAWVVGLEYTHIYTHINVLNFFFIIYIVYIYIFHI